MLKSMTGFGRSSVEADGMKWTVEVSSVNSRFLDVQARLPRALAGAEFALRKRVGEKLSRGKVAVSVTWEALSGAPATVRVNSSLATAYVDKLRELKQSLGLAGDVSVELLASFPDLFASPMEAEDRDRRDRQLLEALDEAIAALESMRAGEGQKLGEDILERLGTITQQLQAMEAEAETYTRALADKIRERVAQLFSDVSIEPQRLAQEAAYLAERSDITEETVRLTAHLEEFQKVLKKGGQVGRRFNFLLQEMVRETNTIGSKTGELSVIQRVVVVKEELEKIREQVQNLE